MSKAKKLLDKVENNNEAVVKDALKVIKKATPEELLQIMSQLERRFEDDKELNGLSKVMSQIIKKVSKAKFGSVKKVSNKSLMVK